MTGTDRTYIPKVEASISFDETPATYVQVVHILEAGVRTDAPAANGTGSSGYVYEYQWPTTTQYTVASNLKTYTIEAGDDEQEEQFLYGFVSSFTLSGAPGQAVTRSAEWMGRQVASGTYTTNATSPTVEEILFNKGKLYIDTAGGTFGATHKTSPFLRFTLGCTLSGHIDAFGGINTTHNHICTGIEEIVGYFSWIKGDTGDIEPKTDPGYSELEISWIHTAIVFVTITGTQIS